MIELGLNLCVSNPEYTVYTPSSSCGFFVVNSTGEVSFIFEKDEQPIPFTQKDKNQIIDSTLKRERKRGLQISKSDAEKGSIFPEIWPLFYGLLNDDEYNIYFRIPRSLAVDPINKFLDFDLFNKDGYYLYRVKMIHPPRIIKDGNLYSFRFDEEGYIYQTLQN